MDLKDFATHLPEDQRPAYAEAVKAASEAVEAARVAGRNSVGFDARKAGEREQGLRQEVDRLKGELAQVGDAGEELKTLRAERQLLTPIVADYEKGKLGELVREALPGLRPDADVDYVVFKTGVQLAATDKDGRRSYGLGDEAKAKLKTWSEDPANGVWLGEGPAPSPVPRRPGADPLRSGTAGEDIEERLAGMSEKDRKIAEARLKAQGLR